MKKDSIHLDTQFWDKCINCALVFLFLLPKFTILNFQKKKKKKSQGKIYSFTVFFLFFGGRWGGVCGEEEERNPFYYFVIFVCRDMRMAFSGLCSINFFKDKLLCSLIENWARISGSVPFLNDTPIINALHNILLLTSWRVPQILKNKNSLRSRMMMFKKLLHYTPA